MVERCVFLGQVRQGLTRAGVNVVVPKEVEGRRRLRALVAGCVLATLSAKEVEDLSTRALHVFDDLDCGDILLSKSCRFRLPQSLHYGIL